MHELKILNPRCWQANKPLGGMVLRGLAREDKSTNLKG
jgi:hypothetical protein